MPFVPHRDNDDFHEPGCIQVHNDVPEPETYAPLIQEAVDRIRAVKEPVALVPAVDKITGLPVVLIGFAMPHPKSEDPDAVAIAPWAVLLTQDELDRYDFGNPLKHGNEV